MGNQETLKNYNNLSNLAKAVIKVMNAVKGMEKNSRVGTGANAYDGTKDQDVKEVFNKALSENGLCIMPIDIKETTQIDRWEEATQYGVKMKQSVFTKVVVKYLMLHISGESIELCGYGQGVDTQDKGAGKSTTYALKNLLLYTFLTPVGKIDDTDNTHSDDIPAPKVALESKASIKKAPKKAFVKIDLTETHPNFEAVKNAINDKGYTIADIKLKYNISPEVEALLTTKPIAQ